MGMYTELVMACTLQKETPRGIIDTLKFMVGECEETACAYDHPLFYAARWKYMLQCDSAYFSGVTCSILKYDAITEEHHLTVRCNLKNYDNEIQKFLDWIYPYSEDREFVGYFRYEECDDPTLIYFDEDGVRLKQQDSSGTICCEYRAYEHNI